MSESWKYAKRTQLKIKWIKTSWMYVIKVFKAFSYPFVMPSTLLFPTLPMPCPKDYTP